MSLSMRICTIINFFLLLSLPLSASLRTLQRSLDPHSLAQHMAFYELYPETVEGKETLAHAWKLLAAREGQTPQPLDLSKLQIGALIALVNRSSSEPPATLTQDELKLITDLSAHFGTRRLKGSRIWTREEVLALPEEEIDLARGVLIEQFEALADPQSAILQYEAGLDLMALQVAARLPPQATGEEKIRALSRFVFQEMHFRFPPHSLHAKDIDLYTFLPSVLDSRQGVCLGVSILYLCLAQRLDLPLEIITPPGHIYLRYAGKEGKVNIETTARGIHLPNATYLGINTRKLQERTIKEVIGMAFVNQASVFWAKREFKKSLSLYEKAFPYMPTDPLVQLFLGLSQLFNGEKQRGRKLLEPLRDFAFDHAVAKETMACDYLTGQIDEEGLKAIFMPVDESRSSILQKQQELLQTVKRFPKFRAGLMQLSVTYLQLGHLVEARQWLERYRAIDQEDPTVAYYLAAICLERLDYNSAWRYLEEAEKITAAKDHFPKALKELRHALRAVCPKNLQR
jgi:regulator of sirC expression with transglutaminase-like and TPR domain